MEKRKKKCHGPISCSKEFITFYYTHTKPFMCPYSTGDEKESIKICACQGVCSRS